MGTADRYLSYSSGYDWLSETIPKLGVSLFGDKNQLPFTVNYMDNTYRYASGNYICVFDGHKTLGFMTRTIKV